MTKSIRKLKRKISNIAILDEHVNNLKSQARAREIQEQIVGYCRKIAEAIDIPKTFINLRDFMQIIDILNQQGQDAGNLIKNISIT